MVNRNKPINREDVAAFSLVTLWTKSGGYWWADSKLWSLSGSKAASDDALWRRIKNENAKGGCLALFPKGKDPNCTRSRFGRSPCQGCGDCATREG